MKNIFFLYIPPNNTEAIIHYQDTIVNKVSQDRIFRYIDQNLKNYLKRVFQDKNIAVWGSRNTHANRSKFEKMELGDNILIVEGDTVKLLGFIAAKTVNPGLSRELWKNIYGETTEGWDLVYFIANPLEIDLPFEEINRLLAYEPNYRLRGFTIVSKLKLSEFYKQYDDLFSILERIKKGEQFLRRDQEILKENAGIIDQDAPSTDTPAISEHIEMQWKLVNLGKRQARKYGFPKMIREK
jgi:hypothetical protein